MFNDAISVAKLKMKDAAEEVEIATRGYLTARGWHQMFLNCAKGDFWSKRLDDGRQIILSDPELAVKMQRNIDSAA